MIRPDILADIEFFPTDKAGRKMQTPPNMFMCTVVINKKNWDTRLLLEKIGSIKPRELKKDVPIKFLSPDIVVPMLKVGSEFPIRDGAVIGKGYVTMIFEK